MNNIKALRKLALSLSLIVLNFCSVLHCQEDVLLSKDEMPGYELVNESKVHWLVSEKNDVHFGISQQWKIMGVDDDIYVYIDYMAFSSATEAMQKTTFNSQSYSLPYELGTPTKSVIGDKTWTCVSEKQEQSDAIIFVKDNIGIKLFIPFYKGEDISQRIDYISKLILEKINNYNTNEQLK